MADWKNHKLVVALAASTSKSLRSVESDNFLERGFLATSFGEATADAVAKLFDCGVLFVVWSCGASVAWCVLYIYLV